MFHLAYAFSDVWYFNFLVVLWSKHQKPHSSKKIFYDLNVPTYCTYNKMIKDFGLNSRLMLSSFSANVLGI